MRVNAPILGLLFAVLGCAISACSSSVTDSTSAGGSGGAGSGGSSSSEQGGGGSGAGQPCDGTLKQWCGYTYYCDAPAGTCPSASAPGTCAPRPDDCTGEAMQVACGCNGQIYLNACEAYAAGVDLGSQEGCQGPADPFACGPVLCENGTMYCEISNENHRCKLLPEACKAPDAMCGCLDEVLCFAAPGLPQCEKNVDGHFVVTCEITE